MKLILISFIGSITALGPPLLWNRKGYNLDVTPLGGMRLEKQIHESADGKVFYASIGDISYVVKYVNDCGIRLRGENQEHPLVTESLFLAKLNETGIAPRVYYLSPPGVLEGHPNKVEDLLLPRHATEFLMDNLEECLEVGTNIRFLVQERVGVSLPVYIFSSILLTKEPSREENRRILKLFAKSVELLERLHKEGIVHGDIHLGNIALANSNNEEEELVFLDFELARLMAADNNLKRMGKPWEHLNMRLLSPWQLEGAIIGPRDDMYRLLINTANLLSKNRLLETPDNIARKSGNYEKQVKVWMEFHKRELMFSQTYLPEMVKNELEQLLVAVRELPCPESTVPFGFMKTRLDYIMDLLD